MRLSRSPLPATPSSSLPPLKSIESLTEEQIFAHLHNLSDIYCPLVFDLDTAAAGPRKSTAAAEAVADSGYVSATEEDDEDEDVTEEALSALRADGFEKSCAERWLTGFIARAEMLACFASEDDCQRALDHASRILETFFALTADEDQQMQQELAEYTREFSFDVTGAPYGEDSKPPSVNVRLNDGLAGTNSSEPDDVGLQSWGASIVVSRLLCAEPERFGLTKAKLGETPRIIELGAGTGLVSLVLQKLLPHLDVPSSTIVATDYHPAVLANLEKNISTNMDGAAGDAVAPSEPVHACLLDWSNPSTALASPPLDTKADMLIATDVIYAPEHALWLRGCSTQMLAPDGVFWLVATVRQNGRFEGVSATVQAAFDAEDRPRGADGRRLTITMAEGLEKLTGVGRGDESGYKLFRIEWA
jgi:predicted nicotinamide N-methyase